MSGEEEDDIVSILLASNGRNRLSRSMIVKSEINMGTEISKFIFLPKKNKVEIFFGRTS
jgi:hypothetical protein